MAEYNISYFAASCDTIENNKAFAGSLDLNFLLLSDPDKQVATQFGVVDDTRLVPRRWTFYIGAENKILAIDKEVQPHSAGEDVLARLKDLEVDKK